MKLRYTDADVDVERFNCDLIGVQEAGHTIAARKLGLTVTAVHVSRREGGVVTADTSDADAELVMSYAGLEAEARFLRKHDGRSSGSARRIARRSARDDLAAAKIFARRAGISRGTAQRRARRLVARHWREICRTGLRYAR